MFILENFLEDGAGLARTRRKVRKKDDKVCNKNWVLKKSKWKRERQKSVGNFFFSHSYANCPKNGSKRKIWSEWLTAQGFNVKDRVLGIFSLFPTFQQIIYFSKNMLLKNASPLARKQFENIHVCGQVCKSVIITLNMLKPYPCFSLNRTTLAEYSY